MENENEDFMSLFGSNQELNFDIPIDDENVDDVVDDCGSRHELKYIEKMLEQGTGADRQLAIFEKTGDLKDVVDYMVSETNLGL